MEFTWNKTELEVAEKIWEIAKISPEHGNALMDIIGEDAYMKVMSIRKETTVWDSPQ